MSNILVTGSTGQLGAELKDCEQSYPDHLFYFTDSKSLDITNHSDVKNFVIENNIEVIINCAAYTAVDKAESEYELSDVVNHLAVKNLAKLSKMYTIKLIQISTDYVFDGESCKPYIEVDATNPQSVYGKTKLAGEQALLEVNPKNTIIIRTSWVYSNYGNNFVKTMLRLGTEREELGVIFDQVGTPTYAKDLASAILKIIPQLRNDSVEVFHYSNEGVCSWFDFSKVIFEIKKINIKIKPITTAEYPTAAKRPFYSVLDKSKIKETFKIEIPYWKDSLELCLKQNYK